MLKLNKKCKYVELHSHLEGSANYKQIWKIVKDNKLNFPFENEDQLRDYLEIKNPSTLREFLKRFDIIIPLYQGHKERIERLCMNYIESYAKSGVCYIEVRFDPYSFVNENLSVTQVMNLILDQLELSAKEHNLVVRIILTALRTEIQPFGANVADLAKKFQSKGVVGIDLAGDELFSKDNGGTSESIIKMFQQAKEDGIHITVHAGENGPASMVKEAIKKMNAERIGHGYAIVTDLSLLKEIKERGIHIEVCPSSSILTGSVPKDLTKHPIHEFVASQVSFSINCDDMMITGRNYAEEIDFCIRHNLLTEAGVAKATIDAAKAAFLNEQEKECLINHIKQCFQL